MRIAILLALTVSSLAAQASEFTKALENKAAFADSIYQADPRYRRAVVVWRVREAMQAKADREGLSPSERTKLIDENTAYAREKLENKKPSDSLEGAIAMDIGTFLDFGETNKYIIKQIEKDVKAVVPYYRPENKAGERFMTAVLDPQNPDHAEALKYMIEDVEWQPRLPFERQAPIERELKHLKVLDSQDAILNKQKDIETSQNALKKLLNGVELTPEESKRLEKTLTAGISKKLKEDLQEIERLKKNGEDINKAINESVQEKGPRSPYWEFVTPEQRAEYRDAVLGDFEAGTRGIGQIAGKLGASDAAEKIQKLANAEHSVRNLMSTFTKDFAKNKGLYLASWAGVAVAFGDILSSQQDDGMGAVLEQLREISRQIQELRKEMHERFDALEWKMQSQFQQTFALLKSIESGQRNIQSQLSDVRTMLTNMQIEMSLGLKTIWSGQEANMIGQCLFTPVDAATLRSCRMYYASLANNVALTDQQVGKLSALEMAQFRQHLQEADTSISFASLQIHPATWLYASQAFLRLFELNRDKAALASEVNSLQPAWSLKGMLEAGLQITQSFETLLLTRKDHKLNTDLLNTLLDRYKSKAKELLTNGRALAEAKAAGGPNPFVGTKQPLPAGHQYKSFKQGVDWCPDLKGQGHVELGKLEKPMVAGLLSSFKGVSGPMVESALRGRITRFSKDAVSADDLIPLIPQEILWAAIMGENSELRSDNQFAAVTITPCWRKISVPSFSLSQASGYKFDLHLELDILLSYQRTGQAPVQSILVRRETLNKTYANPNWDLSLQENPMCDLLARVWNGKGFCSYDGNFQATFEPIREHLGDFVAQEGDSPELKAFQSYFAEFEQGQKNLAYTEFKKQYRTPSVPGLNPPPLDEKRALYLTVFLGLSQDSPAVRAFTSWMWTQEGLPDLNDFAELGLSGYSDADVLTLLNQHIEEAKRRIGEMEKDPLLAPRTAEFDVMIARLRALSGASGGTRRSWLPSWLGFGN